MARVSTGRTLAMLMLPHAATMQHSLFSTDMECLQPVLLGGANIKVSGGIDGFRKLADASKYAVALMSNAKVWQRLLFPLASVT